MYPTRTNVTVFVFLTGTVVLLSLASLYSFVCPAVECYNPVIRISKDAASQRTPVHPSSIIKGPPSMLNRLHDHTTIQRQLSEQTSTSITQEATQIALHNQSLNDKKKADATKHVTEGSTASDSSSDDIVSVVFMPGIWIDAPEIGFKTQKCDVRCQYTRDTNSSILETVDAAVIHLPSNSNNPNDILRDAGLMDPSKIFKVAMSMESERSHPKQFHSLSKYDIEMSYRMDSDVPNPYFTFARGKQDLLEKTNSTWEMREKAVVYVARNCHTQSKRDELVKKLQEHVRVDSVSNCLNNKHWPRDIPRNNKRELLRRYVALLAAENSIERDYVTEKVYAGLITGTVPIYFGAPNIDNFVPSNSIIRVQYPLTKENITELAEKIKLILNSKDEYDRLTHFKQQPLYEDKFLETFNFTRVGMICRLCRKIFSLKHGLIWDHKRQDFH